MTDPVAVAAHFETRWPPIEALRLTSGHIHDTYVVTGRDALGTSGRIILQRLNPSVFPDLVALASNLERVSEHLRTHAARRGTRSIVADPIPTRTKHLLHTDEDGATWRATVFVEGAGGLDRDATADELRAAARAFAELTRDLGDLPRPPLAETIPHFHDFTRRRAQLATAVANDRVARASRVADLISRARELGDRTEHGLGAADAGTLPTRIVHNDAKLDNVLVDATTGAIAGIVDLDTVMAGTVLADFGELVRTAAATAPEDECDTTKIGFDLGRFTALAQGYLGGARPFLLESERACLALAGPLLTMENAVRFLTDYLDGDIYYRVQHADHNAVRARAQLHLAELMLDQLDAMRVAITAASS